MAGKDAQGMSPIDKSLNQVEESPEFTRNPESREKDKPLKKTAEEENSFSAQGPVSQKPRKLFGAVKPFFVHLYVKTEKCMGLKLLV